MAAEGIVKPSAQDSILSVFHSLLVWLRLLRGNALGPPVMGGAGRCMGMPVYVCVHVFMEALKG